MKKRNPVSQFLAAWEDCQTVVPSKIIACLGGDGTDPTGDPKGGGGPPESTIPPPIM